MSNEQSQSKKENQEVEAANTERYAYEKEQAENSAAVSSGNPDDAENSEQAEADEQAFKEDDASIEQEAAAHNSVQQANASSGFTAPPAPVVKKGGTAWMITSLVLAAVLVFVLIKPPFGIKNEAVAKVNSNTIDKESLYEKMLLLAGPSILDTMINNELLEQELKAKNISFTDQDITDEIDAIKMSMGGEEQFQEALKQNNITIEALSFNVRQQALVRKAHEPNTKVTDKEIEEFYEQYKDSIGGTDTIRASHILVDTEEEAKEIAEQLKGGADFAELAKEKSKDGSSSMGGDLGYFGKGQMVPEFEEAAFALEVDQVSDIVKSEFGYHIIKKTEDKKGASLDELKNPIRTMLIGQEAAAEESGLTAELQDKAKIENSLDKNKEETADAK
ncbi:peptidylprolyl isomerase [Paenibacillus sp. GXUN7292]|uniref:peptidylprolyl isomerase n=1 Tax=Paenibacillus sp. GXUN7292 TaxID=3422499 RepID=UPI003D7C929C